MTHRNEACPRRGTEGIAENAGERLGTILVASDEDRTQARCKRCHAPLSRPESVAAELGPVCRHAIDLEAVAP